MTEEAKKYLKKEKRIITILAIWAVTGAIVASIIFHFNGGEKSYEYAKNGQIGHSSNCYLKDDVGYCEEGNIMVKVDNYYEVGE